MKKNSTKSRKRPKKIARSLARRTRAGSLLKCKPGYKQVGAVCQPINRKKKNNILTTSALFAASAIAAKSLLNKRSNGQTSLQQLENTFSSKYAKPLKIAGISSGIVSSTLIGITALTYRDLKTSQEPFDSIRPLPNNAPDAQTIAKYETFKPGDLIRRNFRSTQKGPVDDLIGSRQHYAVYVGKDPKTGIMLAVGFSSKGDKLTGDVEVKDILKPDYAAEFTEYEVVPDSDLNPKRRNIPREQIVNTAKDLVGKDFKYGIFSSNCENFARAIVEGEDYSHISKKVNPLSRFLLESLDNSIIKQSLTNEEIEQQLQNSFSIKDITYKYNQSAKRDSFPKPLEFDLIFANNKSIYSTKKLEEFTKYAGLKPPVQYVDDVELIANISKKQSIKNKIRIYCYSQYLLAIFYLISRNSKNNYDSVIDLHQIEKSLGLVPNLMSQEYILGQLKARNKIANYDSKKRPGHHWVKDRRAKGGGYWRKDPKSNQSGTKTNKNRNLLLTAATATGAAAIAYKNKGKSSPSLPQTTKLSTKTIAASAAAGLGVGITATIAVTRKQREQAVADAYAQGEAKLKQNTEQFAAKEAKLQQDLDNQTAKYTGQISELQEQVEKATTAQNMLNQQIAAQERKIQSLENAETSANQRIAETNEIIEQQTQKIASRQIRVKELESLLQNNTERSSEENLRLQQELVTSRDELTAAKEEITALTESVIRNQEMIQNVQQKRDVQAKELEKLNQSLAQSQEQIQQSNQQNQSLQQQIQQLESQRSQIIATETDKVRQQLISEQEQAISEIDSQAAANLTNELNKQQEKFTAQLTQKQAELEQAIAKGNDPKPLKGQRQSRGDLIATEEGGISLGASSRWGSEFFNLEFSTQLQKVQNKADNLMGKAYQNRLLGLQRDFAESIKSITPQEKSPSRRLLTRSQIANVRDKQLIKQLTGREKELLPKIVQIEKTVAQHHIREEVLGIIEERIRDRVKENYSNLLTDFHNQGAVNPQTLAAFDKRSKAIIKEANGQFDATIRQLISPKFTPRIEALVSDYLQEMPTENIVRRKNRNVSVQLSEKIIEEIFGKKQDSLAYEIGRKQALLKLGSNLNKIPSFV